jgi:hypothetical protein
MIGLLCTVALPVEGFAQEQTGRARNQSLQEQLKSRDVFTTQSVPTAGSPPPQVDQAGKDAIWVPTPQWLVDKMLDMAKITAADTVYDLRSGGRIVITAAKRGATAKGVEYDPDMVELSKRNAARESVDENANFMKADLFETDFSNASVITMFLPPDINLWLRPKILDMKPGTRIVSNTFDMGDWAPDDVAQAVDGCTSYCKVNFWIVPAKVAGTWDLPLGELKLEQKYQMITGTLHNGSVTAPIANGKINGDQITFSVRGTQFTGKVNGSTMEGTWRGTKR